MKVEIPEEKARQIEEYVARIQELLQTAKTLDEAAIPDSVKNMSVEVMEGIPVRVKNMLSIMGVKTLWELVHIDTKNWIAHRWGGSLPRICDLFYAIKEAFDLLQRRDNDAH